MARRACRRTPSPRAQPPARAGPGRRPRRQGRGAPARASRGWAGLGRRRSRLLEARPLPRCRHRLRQRRAHRRRDRAAASRLRRGDRARRRWRRRRGGPPRLRENPEARARSPRAALLAGAREGAGRQARRRARRLQEALLAKAPGERSLARDAVEDRVAEVSRRLEGAVRPTRAGTWPHLRRCGSGASASRRRIAPA